MIFYNYLSAFSFTFQDIINGNFWSYLLDIVTNAFGFLVGLVSSLINSIVMITAAGYGFLGTVGFFPGILSTSMLLVFMIAVVKIIAHLPNS